MSDYKCVKCKKEFEFEFTDKVRCPYCGFRIITKARPKIVKRVVAR